MTFKRALGGCLALLILIAFLLSYWLVFAKPRLDPDAIARYENEMWKAYYGGDTIGLGKNLVGAMRNQFGLSYVTAYDVAKSLGNAAMKFRGIRENYEPAVLPDLIDGYTRIRDASGLGFDPEKAARAELAWWVARRTSGEDDPENVGRLIGELYGVLYGEMKPGFNEAGILRAQAGQLRDQGGKNADWDGVEDLLRKSYRKLVESI